MGFALLRGAAATWLLLALSGPAAAEPATVPTERARWLMGTMFTFRADGGADPGRALDAALDSVAALESLLSNWSAKSELSRLNAAGAAAISPSLAAVLDSALVLARLTDGAFDPTVEALTQAWDLRGAGRVPSGRELEQARSRVGWRRVRIESGAPERADLGGTALDLGGIGKGFALDRAVSVLREHGVTSASLDAGGQWLSLGAAPCSVWVADPTQRERPAVNVVLRGGSLSTSAQSERSVRAGSRHVGHVLDPRTGEPVPTHASVSVWAPSATRADALSTALLVLGREAARGFALAHPGLGVLWLEPSGRGVAAEAWNLEIAGLANGVSLSEAPPTSNNLNRKGRD